MNKVFLLAAALLTGVAIHSSAAKLGDPAAPLSILAWVKGKPVDVKNGKNLYVVEFWATWCGPCRMTIPRLTELQKKFRDKGVVFVGITDEPAEKVKPFVEKMGNEMDYVVACDDDRKTSDGYMAAYGQEGIPTAFIVGKDGKVLWFGSPMDVMEETIEAILAGKYDLAAAQKRNQLRATIDDYHRLSAAGDEKAKQLGREVLKSVGEDPETLGQFAFSITADGRNEHRDFVLANEALDLAEKKAGKNNAQFANIRAITVFESGKHEEGLAMAKKVVELAKDEQQRATYESNVRVMESRIKAKNEAK